MKTKKTILLVLLVGLIVSCNRPVYRDYKLTEVDKQMIPYKLGQTVSCIDSEGQLFILTVTEDTTYISTGREWDNLYVEYSYRVVRLQSETLSITLSIISNKPDDRYNTIRVFIGVGVDVAFSYYEIYYDKEGKFLEQGGSILHNSIDIDGKVYYNVVECNTNRGVNWEPTVPMQFFYNKTYGILQINRDGENFCTLKN